MLAFIALLSTGAHCGGSACAVAVSTATAPSPCPTKVAGTRGCGPPGVVDALAPLHSRNKSAKHRDRQGLPPLGLFIKSLTP